MSAKHTRTQTDSGPDFCAECSEAVHDWVPWPCPARGSVYTLGVDHDAPDHDDIYCSTCDNRASEGRDVE